MKILLDDYQLKALRQLESGKILCGGVGSGKSRTGLAWFYISQGGQIGQNTTLLKEHKDLYIITTAKKRDSLEWEEELLYFHIEAKKVDSWNNIAKYKEVKDAVFIFDEQRLVGNGTWVKSFLEIAKNNKWILLTATPGDVWTDYIPVFLANGFYKNRTEFMRQHVVMSHFGGYPKIDRYMGEGRLLRLKSNVLVIMDYSTPAVEHIIDIPCSYNQIVYKDVTKNRWDPYKNEPIENASTLCYILRKVVNSDSSRLEEVVNIIKEKKRAIIFYNYNYELDLLKQILDISKNDGTLKDFEFSEWNSHKHQDIPKTNSWAYLVQYYAGAEGWQCTKTDSMIFYSQSYSYKTMVQASGRINRRNTPYTDLYYYYLKSYASIDIAIGRALKSKKQFNEKKFSESNK